MLQRAIITLGLCLICGLNFAQSKAPNKPTNKTKSPFYLYKAGKWVNYEGKASSLNDLFKELGIQGRTYEFMPNCGSKVKSCPIIGFKLFTTKPQWAATENPATLPVFTKQFKLSELMNTWKFGFELERSVEKRAIYDAFLLETLGPPNKRTHHVSDGSNFEIWYYYRHELALTLEKGVVTSFTKSE